jgi:hypothetical protein
MGQKTGNENHVNVAYKKEKEKLNATCEKALSRTPAAPAVIEMHADTSQNFDLNG